MTKLTLQKKEHLTGLLFAKFATALLKESLEFSLDENLTASDESEINEVAYMHVAIFSLQFVCKSSKINKKERDALFQSLRHAIESELKAEDLRTFPDKV